MAEEIEASPPRNVPLRCRCGRVQGVAHGVSPARGFRIVCYCGDCQAFARFLQRPDILDAAGGTDIFQMPPGRVKLAAGMEAVRAVRLPDKGVLRWYSDCCRTPIGNTAADPRFPLIGIVHAFMICGEGGRSRDEILGTPVCRIYERSATASLPSDAPPPPTLGLFVRRAAKLLGWWICGLGRSSPLFDGNSKAPLATPRVLTPGERAVL